MRWHPRNLWLVLAAAFTLTAWGLTRWITHVDRRPQPVITVAIDERPPFQFERMIPSISAFGRTRRRFPEIVLTNEGHLLFLVTPATRSITVRGAAASELACASGGDVPGGGAASIADAEDAAATTPIAVQNVGGAAYIEIPPAMRMAPAARHSARAAITCKVAHPLTMAPTFTERAVTVRAETARGGGVLLDVSALEDVDNLRFSGGLQMPLGGDRTRLLYGGDDVVSAEWVDVAASEQRDIVLVIIGALSAIAAAMIIEAVRPAVERRSKD